MECRLLGGKAKSSRGGNVLQALRSGKVTSCGKPLHATAIAAGDAHFDACRLAHRGADKKTVLAETRHDLAPMIAQEFDRRAGLHIKGHFVRLLSYHNICAGFGCKEGAP